MRARREAAGAFLLALGTAGLLLLCAGARWAAGTGRRPVAGSFVQVAGQVTGRSVAPAVTAAVLVAVAGAVAVPAAKRAGRVIAGALMVLAGAAVAIESVAARGTASRRVHAQLPADATVHGSAWPWIALLAGLLLALTGLVLAIRGPRWSAMSSRYQTPAARQGSRPTSATDSGTWDALDRGEDPTA